MINSGFLCHPQQKHNLCYRKVICHSFFTYLKENGSRIEEDKFKYKFKYMLEQIINNRLFLHKGLLEIYPTTMDDIGSEGCFVVDPSHGFTLVLYPHSHTQFGNVANRTRVSAFKTAARKVQKNRSQIFEILIRHDEWTLELERELEKWFEYPPEKTAANDSNFKGGMRKAG